MGTLITTDGVMRSVYPSNPTRGFTLKEMYDLINCTTIETHSVSLAPENPRTLVMDEEGKLNQKEINEKATHLLFGESPIDVVVGDVLLLLPGELK